MTIDEEYDALNVSRTQLREVARLMASGQSSEAIAVQMNLRPIDIDRLPMKYAREWDEEFRAAARFACHMAVLKVMAHAQMIAAETKEPKGLAALMQAIARFLRLPFLFPTQREKRPSERASHEVSGATPPTTNSQLKPTPTVEAPPLTPCAAPSEETPTVVPLPEFTDDEITRCVKLYEADPDNYVVVLEHNEPELYAKCVRYHLLPPKRTPPPDPKPTFTQRLKGYFKAACVWCVAWFGLSTHPPHH